MNTPMTRTDVAALLHRHGIHPTRQRIDVAHVLVGQTRHLSAEQILEQVNAGDSTASKATVYNTLGLLVERGAIRALVVDATRVLYDPNTTPHHHFFNTATGELTDFPAGPVHVAGLPSTPPGTLADGVDIVVRIRPAPPEVC
jgi:Fur family iron response transcriptional regulator